MKEIFKELIVPLNLIIFGGIAISAFIQFAIIVPLSNMSSKNNSEPTPVTVLLPIQQNVARFRGTNPQYINGGVKFKDDDSGKDTFVSGNTIIVIEKLEPGEDFEVELVPTRQQTKEKQEQPEKERST